MTLSNFVLRRNFQGRYPFHHRLYLGPIPGHRPGERLQQVLESPNSSTRFGFAQHLLPAVQYLHYAKDSASWLLVHAQQAPRHSRAETGCGASDLHPYLRYASTDDRDAAAAAEPEVGPNPLQGFEQCSQSLHAETELDRREPPQEQGSPWCNPDGHQTRMHCICRAIL